MKMKVKLSDLFILKNLVEIKVIHVQSQQVNVFNTRNVLNFGVDCYFFETPEPLPTSTPVLRPTENVTTHRHTTNEFTSFNGSTDMHSCCSRRHRKLIT